MANGSKIVYVDDDGNGILPFRLFLDLEFQILLKPFRIYLLKDGGGEKSHGGRS